MRDSKRQASVQGNSRRKKVRKDLSRSYLVITGQVERRGEEMVYCSHIQTREDDSVSYTATDIAWTPTCSLKGD